MNYKSSSERRNEFHVSTFEKFSGGGWGGVTCLIIVPKTFLLTGI